MATSEKYIKQARSLNSAGLRRLWSQVVAGDTPDWPSGKALEHLILRAFELEGVTVTWPFDVSAGGKTIEQVDGVIYVDGLAVLAECKDYQKPVNFEPTAKLRQQLSRRPPSTMGCCFAKNGFTDEAILLAEKCTPQNVLLWPGEEIEFALRKRIMREGLISKYRHSVEHALPDFKINIS